MQIVSIAELARSITPLPSFLATRGAGKRFWELMQSRLSASDPREAITLTFNGIEVMDASFADEVFGTLASQHGRREGQFYPVLLSDLNETCLDNLRMALETRPDREPPDRERLRNCVLPVIENGDIKLIGKFEDHVAETFRQLQESRTLTARDLAAAMGLNLNAASTRLKTLADLGLALRSEVRDTQGKQFVYRCLE